MAGIGWEADINRQAQMTEAGLAFNRDARFVSVVDPPDKLEAEEIMGIKDLFARKEAYTLEEKKLILALMALRITHAMQASGYSEDDAKSQTNYLLNNTDLSGDKILQSSEATILRIVKDYVKIISDNLSKAKQQKINIDIERIKAFAFKTIDGHRDKFLSLPVSQSVPDDLYGFILYRVLREIEAGNGEDPERLGFTKTTVHMLTDVVKAAYQPTINFRI